MDSFLKNLNLAIDASSIVAITDPKGKITYVNERFCEVSEYSEDELLGQDHRMLNSGLHEKEFFHDLWETITSGNIWKGEICNKTKSGALYWVLTTIIPFKDHNDRIYQFMAIRQEITQWKQLDTQINAMEKFSTIGSLSAQILHEINNPLSILQTGVMKLERDLERGADKDKISKTVETLHKNIDRIQGLTKSVRGLLVDFDEPVPTTIKKLLEHIHPVIGPKLRHGNIELLIKLTDTIIELNPNHISQVLLNVIGNACDAIDGTDNAFIEIKDEVVDGVMYISITDSGEGISKEIAAKIFEPLFTTKKGSGTGLGLQYCRKILDKVGGDISLNEDCKNTQFVVILPLKAACKKSA